MTKVFALGRVNLVRFFRDRSNYFFALLLPLGLVFVLGMSFGAQSRPTIGVVGTGEVAERFFEALSEKEGLVVTRVDDAGALRDGVERGRFVVGVALPAELDATLEQGLTAQAELYGRSGGGGEGYRFDVLSALDEASAPALAAAYLAKRYEEPIGSAFVAIDEASRRVPPVNVRVSSVDEGPAGFGYAAFGVAAASQLVLFVFLTGLTSATSLVDSRRLGVSHRMLASPTSPAVIVLGEGFGRFLVTLFQGLYIAVASALLVGVVWGDPLGVFVILLCFAAVAAGAGTLIGAMFSSSQQASGVAIMAGLLLAALGGCMFPLELFGPTMRSVANAVPHAWAVDALNVLMRQGGNLASVLPNVGVLLAFATLLFALAAWRLRVGLTKG